MGVSRLFAGGIASMGTAEATAGPWLSYPGTLVM